MRKILILGLILLAAGCKSRKTGASASEKFELESLATIIAANDLEAVYPEANISEGKDLFEEGTVERAYSILYPGTADELLITWKDEQRSRLHEMRFDKNGRWKTRDGIKVGMSYDDLVRLNGNSIKFYGFGWDYSGAVDWNGGKMADSKVRVFLAPKETPSNKFIGDQIVEATPEEIDALDLSVQAVMYRQD